MPAIVMSDRGGSGRREMREDRCTTHIEGREEQGDRDVCLGIPGQLVEMVDEDARLAKVDVGGVKRNVNVGLLDPGEARPGDWVLIHVGFAMSKIDEDEAKSTLDFLEGLGQTYDDELEQLKASDIG